MTKKNFSKALKIMIIYINSIFLYVCDCMYHTPLNENLITVRWSLQVKKPSKHKNQTRCGFFFRGQAGTNWQSEQQQPVFLKPERLASSAPALLSYHPQEHQLIN